MDRVIIVLLLASAAAAQSPKAPDFPLTAPKPEPAPAAAAPRPTGNVTPASAASLAGMGMTRSTQVKVVASIGHEAVITEDEVMQLVRGRAREYADLTGAKRVEKEKQIYAEELKELIGRELMVLELFDRMRKNKAENKIEEIRKYASDNADRELRDRLKRQGLDKLSEAEFVKMLQAQGMSYKVLKRQIEQDTLGRIYLEQLLKDKVKQISVADLWDYYQDHPKDFAVADEVQWLDLFVSFRNFPSQQAAKEHATAAWKSAMAGADFKELVKKYGQGDSNLRGGEGIGTKRGEIQPAEIEPILMDMTTDQVSPLLQTATGYHIVKVTKRQKAGVMPFDEKMQAAIRNRLGLIVQEKERQKIIEELWRKHRPKVVEQ